MAARLNFPFDLSEQIENGVNYVAFKTIHLNNPDAGEMCFMYMPKSLGVTDGASYSGVDLGANKAARALGAELGVGESNKLCLAQVCSVQARVHKQKIYIQTEA